MRLTAPACSEADTVALLACFNRLIEPPAACHRLTMSCTKPSRNSRRYCRVQNIEQCDCECAKPCLCPYISSGRNCTAANSWTSTHPLAGCSARLGGAYRYIRAKLEVPHPLQQRSNPANIRLWCLRMVECPVVTVAQMVMLRRPSKSKQPSSQQELAPHSDPPENRGLG